MGNSLIGNILKTRRKYLNLSVKSVLEQLHNCGINISDKTLYGWENGHRQPDADTFIVLCRIYGIETITEIQSVPHATKTAPPYTSEAMKLAKDLDQQSREDELAAAIRRLASGESEDFKRRFVSALSKLNEDEWAALERFAKELVDAFSNTEAAQEIAPHIFGAAGQPRAVKDQKEMTDKELHDELDRQILEEKIQAEKQLASGAGSSDTAIG